MSSTMTGKVDDVTITHNSY